MDNLQILEYKHGRFLLHGHLIVHEFLPTFSETLMDGDKIYQAIGFHGPAHLSMPQRVLKVLS